MLHFIDSPFDFMLPPGSHESLHYYIRPQSHEPRHKLSIPLLVVEGLLELPGCCKLKQVAQRNIALH